MKHFKELPQYLLGKLMVKILKAEEGTRYYTTNKRIGVSFGPIIIIWEGADHNSIKHETGHSLQSRKLGWLYLLVVGLPSITMNILTRLHILKATNYYKRWPESWADKLAGVKRDT